MTLPTRITLQRAKGWRLQAVAPGAIKVDRGGKGLFGNPWIAGAPAAISLATADYWLADDMDPARVVATYEWWLAGGYPNGNLLPAAANYLGRAQARLHLWTRREAILSALPTLRGKPLACWCKPGCPCHADILLRLANG